MSEAHNNDAAADGSKGIHDASNQVVLQTTEGNDSRQQMFVVVDFDPRHVFRALFHVPVHRSKGLVTLADGRTVHEKQLPSMGDFLTLRERVEFRHRVVALGQNLCMFPRWDFDGPDMRFFGEWKTNVSKTEPYHMEAGPWVLDGRQLVADARDITVMLVEAAQILQGTTDPLTLCIHSPVPISFQSQRGWDLKRGPYDAWWSGVRKAAETLANECPHVTLVAVAETNPFAELTRASHVQWSTTNLAGAVVCEPCDPFTILGGGAEDAATLTAHGMSPTFVLANLMMGLLGNFVPVRSSIMVPRLRHPLWVPRDRLSLLNPKGENKCK